MLHRAEAFAWADPWRVAADLAFVEAKCREIGAHDTEATWRGRLRGASGDQAQGDHFADLARALDRESRGRCLWRAAA